MTPEEARQQARALLQSTDALLGGLLAVATQLREAVAVMQNTVDQTEPRAKVVQNAPQPLQSSPETMQNGHMTLHELHEQLQLAGFRFGKNTLNSYACQGQIPCEKIGKHRYFVLRDVLAALNTKRRQKRNEMERPPAQVEE